MKYAILIILLLAFTSCEEFEVEKTNQEVNTKDKTETAENKDIKDATQVKEEKEPEEELKEDEDDDEKDTDDIKDIPKQEVKDKPKISLTSPLAEIKKLDLEKIEFQNFDIVVGDDAPATDVISAANIAVVTGSKTILASEADNVEYILVGSPCINKKMAELIPFFNKDLCDGYEYPLNFQGTIYQVDDNIIVWGKTPTYTRKLSEMVQDIGGELVVI